MFQLVWSNDFCDKHSQFGTSDYLYVSGHEYGAQNQGFSFASRCHKS